MVPFLLGYLEANYVSLSTLVLPILALLNQVITELILVASAFREQQYNLTIYSYSVYYHHSLFLNTRHM